MECLVKRSTLLICTLFLILTAQAQWKQDRFIIGTFYDPKLPNNNIKDTAIYAQKLRQVKDSYFNLLTGMDHNYDDPAFINYKLNLINKLGLKTLLINQVSWGKGNTTFNKAKADSWLNYTTKLDAGKRNAFYGYFIFDEPFGARMKDVNEWLSYIKGRDKNRLAYVNLLPIYVFKSKAEYDQYLNTFLSSDKSKGVDVVSYDFYPFVQAGGIKPGYFYNLYILKQKAKGRPIWCYVLTTKHREYAEIGPYELNFMVFAPLIYGVKGILYFTYETIVGSTMPYGRALMDEKNRPTNKYYQIKNINRFLSKVAGPIIMGSDNIGTYHVSNKPYSNQEIDKSEILNDNTPLVGNMGNENMSVGIFRSRAKTNEYNLLFFNKSSKSLKRVQISLKGNYQNKLSLSIPYAGYTTAKAAFQKLSATYNRSRNTTVVSVDFTPGEARIIKVNG